MKKSELKNGAVVETRNGNQYVVKDDRLHLLMPTLHYPLSAYNDDLTYKAKKFADIVKVDNSNHLDINWSWERKENILTDKEREYLKAVIEPIKDRIHFIQKTNYPPQRQYIYIQLDIDCIDLYAFPSNTQFKGMESGREYTLKELGLEK